MNCPDCGVAPKKEHQEGCDVARCVGCGQQQLSCDVHIDTPMQTWTGLWPGVEECQEWGWYLAPGLEDLNRLYTDDYIEWSGERQRWVRKQMAWYLPQDGGWSHLAPSKHSRTACGWNLLHSKGLPREVQAGEDVPRCDRCEQKQREQ